MSCHHRKPCDAEKTRPCADCGKDFCDKHLWQCRDCGEDFCLEDSEKCADCEKIFCYRHLYRCHRCRDRFCDDDSGRCRQCEKDVCLGHSKRCGRCDARICDSCEHNCKRQRDQSPDSPRLTASDAFGKAKTALSGKRPEKIVKSCNNNNATARNDDTYDVFDDDEDDVDRSGEGGVQVVRDQYQLIGCDHCYRCADSCLTTSKVIPFGPTEDSNGCAEEIFALCELHPSQDPGCTAFMIAVLITDRQRFAARSGTREWANVSGLREAIQQRGYTIVEEVPSAYCKTAGGCIISLTNDLLNAKGTLYRHQEVGRCAAQRVIRAAIAAGLRPRAITEMWFDPGKTSQERIHYTRCTPCTICQVVVPQILCNRTEDELS